MERPGQTDTTPVEKIAVQECITGPTSILEEKLAGGLTPLTRPVGGTPAPYPTDGSRGVDDAEALGMSLGGS